MDLEQNTYQSLLKAVEVLTKKVKEVEIKNKKTVILEEDELFMLKFLVLNLGKYIYLTSFEYDLVTQMLDQITDEEKAGKSDTKTYLKMINFLIEENNELKRENKKFKETKKEINKLLDKEG